jgi:pyridoxine 5-phosphate synthase
MPRLYVNLDHVATIRQARGTPYPSVFEAARIAAASGHVAGVTLHLREDRRHVQDEDLVRIATGIPLPFNFELSAAPEIVALCRRLKPVLATLVPERREERTTEGGLDLARPSDQLREAIAVLQGDGIPVSLFIEPDRDAVSGASRLGVSHIELHTGRYAEAFLAGSAEEELARLVAAARAGRDLGLVVNAGHGLTAENVGPVAAIPGLAELNIGHAIIARAIFIGLPAALAEMRAAIAAPVPLPAGR